MTLFEKNYAPNIKLECLEKPVTLAALELQHRLRQLSGNPKGFVMSPVGKIVMTLAPGPCTAQVTDSQVRLTAPQPEQMAQAVALFEAHWLAGLSPREALELQPGIRKG